MNKYFRHVAHMALIAMLVFVFSILVGTSSANAQVVVNPGPSSTCQLIQMLINIGVIPPQNGNAALMAFGCSGVTPVTPSLQIELVSHSLIKIETEMKRSRAAGVFTFKATAINSDVYLSASQQDTVLDVFKNGVSVGSSMAVALTANFDSVDDYFLIQEGTTETFTISYMVSPIQGTGFYSAKATSIMLKNGEKVYFEGFESDKVYLEGVTGPYTSLNVGGYDSTGYQSPVVDFGNVATSSKIEIRWNSKGATHCNTYGLSTLKLTDGTRWDLDNLPTSGFRYFYPFGQTNLLGQNVNSASIGIQCWSAQGASEALGMVVSWNSEPSIPQPSITVLSPNGGETIVQGEQHSNKYSISWDGRGLSSVHVFLVPADSDGSGSGALGVIGSVDAKKYSTIWWDGRTVWTDLHDGKEVNVPVGAYKIYLVGDIAGISGKAVKDISDSYFKIVSSTSTNKPPVIKGVTSPTRLAVNTKGTWSVQASDPENGPLSYSINWGDEPIMVNANIPTVSKNFVQTSTFTHSYSYPGTYRVTIVVKDREGLTAETSSTVVVQGVDYIATTTPIITPVKPPVIPPVTSTISCKFEAVKYADYYPDLKAAFGYNDAQLKTHWLNYGLKEGRTPCGAVMPACRFNSSNYVNLYSDLVKAKVNGESHYRSFGVNEGRNVCQETKTAMSSVQNYATAAVGWSTFLKLLDALK